MPGSDNQNDQRILPIVGPAFASLWQCLLSGAIFQTFANAKSLIESRRPIAQTLRANPKVFTSGIMPGTAYSILAMFPPKLMTSLIGKEEGEDGKMDNARYFGIALTATLLETSFGVPLEFAGQKRALELLGIDVSKQAMRASHRAFYPFFMRNNLGWLVFTYPTESLTEKAALGGLAGILSTPFDTFGNFAMKNLHQSFFEGCRSSARDMMNMPFPNLVRASLVRGAGIGIGSVFLSEQCQKALEGVFNPLIEQLEDWNDRSSSKQDEERPAESVSGVKSSESLKKEEQETKATGKGS